MITARVAARLFAASLLSFAPPVSAQAPVADTLRQTRLWTTIGMQGAHLSLGLGGTPYLDGTAGTLEMRLGFTPRAIPRWTIAVAGGFIADTRPTAYVAPGTDGLRPELWTATGGIEVQHRWPGSRRYHPLAFAGVGSVTNSYRYSTRSAEGGQTYHQNEVHSTPFASLGAGGEVRVTGWLRGSGLVGYRAAGAIDVPHAAGTNGGMTFVAMLSAGWF
jgi:hypothetical protein